MSPSKRRYTEFNYPSVNPGNTLLTGVRQWRRSEADGDVLISGFFEPKPQGRTRSFVYKGPLSSKGSNVKNNFHELDYPSAPGRAVVSTSLYGPNKSHVGLEVVGNYTTQEQPGITFGCLYQGPLDGSGTWRTLTPPGATQVIAHSNMGGLVVGNYIAEKPHAFIYDIYKDSYVDISAEAIFHLRDFHVFRPNFLSITAYGIWHNGGSHFSICGGYVDSMMPELERAYIVDWDNERKRFNRFRIFTYRNRQAAITHFDGITTDGCGGFYLTGDYVKLSNGAENAFFAHVFEDNKVQPTWETLEVPPKRPTSGNTVIGKTAIGVYQSKSGLFHGYLSKPKRLHRH